MMPQELADGQQDDTLPVGADLSAMDGNAVPS
jgi:hypothetical protein